MANTVPVALAVSSVTVAGYVYLSYSRADRTAVDRLAAELSAAGVPVWYDHALDHASRWSDVVEPSIRSCAAFIPVLSPARTAEAWPARESQAAQQYSRPVFPVLLAGESFGYSAVEDLRTGGPLSPAFLQRLRATIGLPGAWPQVAPSGWRRPAVLAAAALVVFLLLAVGAVALYLANSGDAGRPAAAGAPTATRTTGPRATTTTPPTTATCRWEPAPAPSSVAPGMDATLQPDAEVPAIGRPRLTLATNRGAIVIEMDRSVTPCTAASMAFLAGRHYYDNSTCHRLVQDIFALQCGDPTGSGEGGPGYQFADENLQPDKLPAYHQGDVAMANAGPGTNGSQFFFVYGVSTLPGDYPLFGHVVSGLDIVEAVGAGGDDGAFDNGGPGGGHPKLALTIRSATIN